MNKPVHIGLPRLTRRGNAWRVEAEVDGVCTWFETTDVPLAPRAEAFASAFLVPAAAAGRRLEVAAPVCATWRSNTAMLLPIFRAWWGHTADEPIVTTTPVGDGRLAAGLVPRRQAACFSGGADSFYTLLRSRHPIDQLLFVHGFDIPIDDDARAAAFEPVLRSTAAQTGRSAVALRTNLRTHPLFAAANWEHTHGGALAAAAHVLAGTASLVIPSSFRCKDPKPWGSSWMTDAWWSSADTRIIHDDAELTRRQKLLAIGSEPLLFDRLRVCFLNMVPGFNCSACTKCLSTMLALHAVGTLSKYTTFDHSVSLAKRFDALTIKPYLAVAFEDLLPHCRPGDPVVEAVRQMIDRSRPLTRLSKVRRWGRRTLNRFGIASRPTVKEAVAQAASVGPTPADRKSSSRRPSLAA